MRASYAYDDLTSCWYDATMIDDELVRRSTMAMTTISPKFQIVIPKEVREKPPESSAAVTGGRERRGYHSGARGASQIAQGSA